MLKVILSVLPNLALGLAGLAARAFDLSGLVAGVVCGSVITYALGPGGFVIVLAFLAAGSVTTKVRFGKKRALGIEEAHGGKRTWKNAVGNLGVPAMSACVAIVRPAALAQVFTIAAIAAATSDTVSSEVGKAFSRSVLTLHNLKVKEAGVPGGVSAVGTVWGAIASAGICLIGLAFGLIDVMGVGWILIAALVASLLESLLKSGFGLRSGHAANLLNTFVGGLIGALIVGSVKRI